MKILEKLDYSHFEQMEKLEAGFYGREHITPAKQVYAWYERYPYTTVAAEDAGRIVGFINLFPVTDRVFERLMSGSMSDSDLSEKDIVDICASDTEPLHMFLSCIVVEEEYRQAGLTRALVKAAVAAYEGVESRCDVILTDNVTEDGQRFSRKYGFALMGSTGRGTWLYSQMYGRFCEKVRSM